MDTLPNPYYERDGITIYHADCRDILPLLSTVDLVLTDPPYGVNYQSNFRAEQHDLITGDNDTKTIASFLPLALGPLQDGRHAYFFGRWQTEAWPVSQSVELIWNRGKPGMGNLSLPWGVAHETITFIVKRKSQRHREVNKGALSARLRKGSILTHHRTDCDLHPTQKPIMLLRELIESSSCFGEIVLDPFMGSGSTIVAAEIEGRRSIGIEIEERYCEIAVKRLQQSVMRLDAA